MLDEEKYVSANLEDQLEDYHRFCYVQEQLEKRLSSMEYQFLEMLMNSKKNSLSPQTLLLLENMNSHQREKMKRKLKKVVLEIYHEYDSDEYLLMEDRPIAIQAEWETGKSLKVESFQRLARTLDLPISSQEELLATFRCLSRYEMLELDSYYQLLYEDQKPKVYAQIRPSLQGRKNMFHLVENILSRIRQKDAYYLLRSNPFAYQEVVKERLNPQETVFLSHLEGLHFEDHAKDFHRDTIENIAQKSKEDPQIICHMHRQIQKKLLKK